MTARLSEMIAVQMEGESRGSGSPLLCCLAYDSCFIKLLIERKNDRITE